jgi:hypothetical protein
VTRAALLVAAALAVAGCFKPDLTDGLVVCGTDGRCPSGMQCNPDNNHCYRMLPEPGDMSVVEGSDMTLPPVSTDMAGLCAVDGIRVCLDSTRAAVCMGGNAMVDRVCPPGSMCNSTNGHCAPPGGAMNCVSTKDCTGGQVCVEYVVSNVFAGFCTAPVAGATGGVNSACMVSTPGNDSSCRTGICAARDATSRACFNPCNTNADCGGGGINCTPLVGPSAIEGASTAALKFCIK